MSRSLERLSPFVGVELKGVDPRRPLTPGETAVFKQAFREHHLILVRGYELSEEQQVAICEVLGKVSSRGGKGYAKPDRKFSFVSNVHEDGVFREGELSFHADLTFLEFPLKARALHSLLLPDSGGDTLFSNVGKAYEELPDAMKKRIEGLRARHAITYEKNGVTYVDEFVRPIVEPHPETGRPVLMVSRAVTKEIIGMERPEFRALLKELWAHIENPRFIYRHQWCLHDFVYWDNFALQHARTNFEGKRALRAVSIDSEEVARRAAA